MRSKNFSRLGISHALFHSHGLVAELDRTHTRLDGFAPMHRRMIGDVDVGDDDADLHEGLVLAEQPQVHQVLDARLLKVGQMFGVVDVALRVQIPVTDFDGMMEMIIAHATIIAE